MSETAPTLSPERQQPVAEAPAERQKPTAEAAAERAEHEASVKSEQLEQAHAAIDAAEQTSNQPRVVTLPPVERPIFIDNVVKTLRLNQSLKRVQSKLNPGDKALSKVVHQPLVRAVSETSAKTVSRPSGILGGGILAFVGSLSYWLLAKEIGFHYNYFVFVVLFVAGFFLGLLIELLLRGVSRKTA